MMDAQSSLPRNVIFSAYLCICMLRTFLQSYEILFPLQTADRISGLDQFWHERAAFQWSAFGRSTAGNNVVAIIIISFFSFFPVFFLPLFFSSVATFSHRRSARIKKLILRKLLRTPKNLGVDTFPDPVGHFGAPWRPFWILQAVRRCRRCGVAGGQRAPPSPLGWYFFFFFSFFFSVVYFSHRRSALIKKLIQRKLTGASQNLGVDTFPDPVGHFGAHWQAVRHCRR